MTALCYQFIVDGVLSDRALAAFPELRAAVDDRHRTTTLYGMVADRTAMRGILARLDNLGFTLLELRQMPN